MSATYLQTGAATYPSDRVWDSPAWIKAPTALDGLCSVFDIFGADDILTMVDAKNLEPYEVVAAHAWQRVGDSMYVVLDARLPTNSA